MSRMWLCTGGLEMSRKNLKKLISLDQECWDIISSRSGNRTASIFVRNAIKHFHKWDMAGQQIPLVKDGTLANRFDANTINMRLIEKENEIEATMHTLNEKIIENHALKQRLELLEKDQENNNPGIQKLKKWWHIFFVGFRR